MGFSCGLVGLPNVGKSTIFNALTAAGAKVDLYPFTTIKPNIGIVAVPDERLDKLHTLFPEKKRVPTTLEFMDIAGLVKGASRGEGLGNQFLAEIRNVDAIVHVVRCFEDPNVAHVSGSIDPRRDIEIVETELLLKDLETVENRLEKVQSKTRAGDKVAKTEFDFFSHIKEELGRGRVIRELALHEEEKAKLKELSLLSAKPVLYVANVGDEGENEYSKLVEHLAMQRGGACVTIQGRLEAEIIETAKTDEERGQYYQEWGIAESGLSKLIKAGYALLNLITFFTTDGPEVRAWTVPKGTHAPQAGGKIHTDFAERFIQAEVIRVEAWLQHRAHHKLHELGLIHKQGHKYEVQDGDVIHFVVA